jgi:RNA polymerase sigma-70 factor (ECF subfamily)
MNFVRPARNACGERFEALLDRHRGVVGKVVGAFAWNQEDQLDLHQEIVVRLWAAFERYDPSRPFATWMYQVALNTAISWSRDVHRRCVSPVGDALPDVADPRGLGAEAVSLWSLLASLDEFDRALMLLLLEQHSHAEIAEILGISVGNVGVKVSRLRSRLRREDSEQ